MPKVATILRCQRCNIEYTFTTSRGIKYCSMDCYQATRVPVLSSIKANRRVYTRKSAPKEALRNKTKYKLLRQRVIEAYGGKCHCCGVAEIAFLTIEHKNNDGAEERKLGYKAAKLLNYIIRQGYPDKYTVACFNCNSGREANGGICPHKEAA